jgi:hypothetical protein
VIDRPMGQLGKQSVDRAQWCNLYKPGSFKVPIGSVQ